MRLQPEVLVIAGAATGIGHTTEVGFAREGASVVTGHIRSPKTPNRIEEEIKSFGRTIFVELLKEKITVNNVGIGPVYKPIDAGVAARPEFEKLPIGEIPLNRWGTPQEIEGLAVYRASVEEAYLTGSTFFIDGRRLRPVGSY